MKPTRRDVLGSAIGLAVAVADARANEPDPRGMTRGEAFVARSPDGLDISGRSMGDPAREEILLVHGLGQSRLSWDRQTDSMLAEQFRLVTCDLRGYGDSDKPAAIEAYADGARWADDLQAVIEWTGLRRPSLVGWSLGGLVIGHYLARHGHGRIAGVNLVNAVTKLSPQLLQPAALDFAAKLASSDFSVRIDAIGAFLASCFATLPPDDDFKRMLVFNGMVPRSVQEGVVRIKSDGLDRAFARAPRVLVTYGEEDALTRPAMSKRVLHLNPQARLSTYPGAGHTPFYERPERFNRELAAFATG